MTENYVNALVRLIDDPDENIYSQVKKRISSIGSAVIPILEHSRDDDFDLLYQTRIDELIKEIQFEETKNELKNWIASDDKNLLDGALIVAKYQYPALEEEKIKATLHEIKTAIWLELSPVATAFEKVNIINEIFYKRFGFKGNEKNVNAPIGFYVNTALELKVGNPLSLSIIYSVLAEMLEIPIYCVNLPKHFILAYMDEMQINTLVGNTNKYGVLFYLDAFNNGKIVDEKAVAEYLDSKKLPHDRCYFEPCSNSQTIKRMLNSLSLAYHALGQFEKMKDIETLKKLFA